MPDIQTPHRTGPALTLRTAAAWMVTFAGFPLGSVAAGLIAGPVDGPVAALAGGFITGAVIGGLQAWGLGHNRPPALQWVLATALGLMLGLWAGAGLVGFATDPSSLVIQGAICGAAVGLAQGVVLVGRLGVLAFGWPVLLSAAWALGWTITTAVGVEVGEQFTVFGSSGAVTVTALTLVLPYLLNRAASTENRS